MEGALKWRGAEVEGGGGRAAREVPPEESSREGRAGVVVVSLTRRAKSVPWRPFAFFFFYLLLFKQLQPQRKVRLGALSRSLQRSPVVKLSTKCLIAVKRRMDQAKKMGARPGESADGLQIRKDVDEMHE